MEGAPPQPDRAQHFARIRAQLVEERRIVVDERAVGVDHRAAVQVAAAAGEDGRDKHLALRVDEAVHRVERAVEKFLQHVGVRRPGEELLHLRAHLAGEHRHAAAAETRVGFEDERRRQRVAQRTHLGRGSHAAGEIEAQRGNDPAQVILERRLAAEARERLRVVPAQRKALL